MSQKQKPPRSLLRRLFRAAWISLALLIVVLFAVHQFVLWSGEAHVLAANDTPPTACILVLGASVLRDGSPSHMLEDRLRVTVALARRHPEAKILVSGDKKPGYDEVAVMAHYLTAHGVAVQRITGDTKGYRTFDSLHRARHVYGFEQVTVVTNPFHIARAVFLGRQLGIDANGVAAPHGVAYSRETLWQHQSREIAARLLAFADVFLLGTKPRASS